MNSKKVIQEKIGSIKKRLNSFLLIDALLTSLLWSFCLSFFIFVGYGVYLLATGSHFLSADFSRIDAGAVPFLFPILLACGLTLLSVAFGLFWSYRHFKTAYEAAIKGDQYFELKDRLSTSNYLLEGRGSATEEIQKYIFDESAQRAEKIDPQGLKGPSFKSKLTSLPMTFFLALLGFASLYFLEPAIIQATTGITSEEKASVLLEKTAKEIEDTAKKKKIKEGLEISKMLKKAAKDIKDAKVSKKVPLQKLKKKLSAFQKKHAPKPFEKALEKAISALKESKHSKEIGKELEKQNFSKAHEKTDSLSKEVKKGTEKFSKGGEKKKLAKAAQKAAEALKNTKLDNMAKMLGEIAKKLDPEAFKKAQKGKKGDKSQMAKNMDLKNKNAKDINKMLAKAMKAMKGAEKMLGGKQLAKNDKLQVYKGPLPKGTSKMGKSGQNQPNQPQPPIQPGPMKDGKQGQGQQAKQEIYKGPCDYTCPYSGQCMKCPCRGKKQGICPYTKKRCACKHCESSRGGGSGAGSAAGSPQGAQGSAQAQAKGQGGGKGGLKAGKGAAGLTRGKPKSFKSEGRKTRLKGQTSKDGESTITVIKSYKNKEETSVEYKKTWQKEKAASEDSIKKEKLPLSKRLLIKKYFDAIKPKD